MSDADRQTLELRYGPPTPPPPATPPSPQSPPPSARRGMPAAGWPLVVLMMAAVAGAFAAGGVYLLASAGSDNGWDSLGAFLFGLLVAVVVFAVAYVLGLVLAARRAFPPGQRVLPVAFALGLPALIAAVTTALAAASDALGADVPVAAGWVALVGALVAAPAAFAWATTSTGRRRLAVGAAAVVALVLGISAAGVGLGRAQLEQVADQLPLVLFAGDTAEAPFDGWRRDEFRTNPITESTRSFAEPGKKTDLRYFTPEGVVFITMYTEVGACRDTPTFTCRVVGTINGNQLRSYERISGYGSYSEAMENIVLVYPEGGAVSVNITSRKRTPIPLRITPQQVLEQLVRVDRHAFEEATGAPFRMR